MAEFLNFHSQIRANKFKTILFVIFFVLAGLVGAGLGLYIGNLWSGIIIAILAGGIYAAFALVEANWMVLTSVGAREVTKKEYPHVFHSIEGLAIAAGLPTPKMYVIDSPALNAFASGTSPDNAAITLTTGLIQKLNREEIEGVIAHEMAHIVNYDIRVMVLASVLVGLIAFLSHMFWRMAFLSGGSNRDRGNAQIVIIVAAIALAIFAPLIAQLMRLAVSRRREYLADATGAKLTRYPLGLANALQKIRDDNKPLEVSDAVSHLCISSPRKTGWWENLFSTHPPIDERIELLKRM